MPFPQLSAWLRVLFQQADQLREPWKRRDPHANRECHDGGDQVFVQPCICRKDHGGDGGGHRGNQHDDGSFDPGEVQDKGDTQSEQQPARHAHDDAERGQGKGAVRDGEADRESQHEAGQRRRREMKRGEDLAEPIVKMQPEE